MNGTVAMPSFEEAEYSSRLRRLRESMLAADVNIAIITAPDTMAWLHGFRSRWYRHHTSSSLPPAQCTVVHATDGEPFIIDAGYHEQLIRSTSVVSDLRLLEATTDDNEATLADYIQHLAEQLAPWRDSRAVVGLERWSCVPSPAVSDVIEAMLRDNGFDIADISLPFREVRRLKSPAEIRMIERAQVACDSVIRALVKQATPQMTELEGWAIYSLGMVRAGGEPAALHETVAAGSSVSAMHRLSSQLSLGSGPVFHPDMASAVGGYHARATRPVVFDRPSAEQLRQAEAAAGAYEVVLKHGEVGTPWSVLLGALRRYWDETGINGGCAGYELGLSVPPSDWVGEFTWALHNDHTGVIEPGLVTNFETWSELALVDTIVFEESGPRFLSSLPREILVAE
jgi:Xaa-Pro aminopeptidase